VYNTVDTRKTSEDAAVDVMFLIFRHVHGCVATFVGLLYQGAVVDIPLVDVVFGRDQYGWEIRGKECAGILRVAHCDVPVFV
jgi:hypothetical protein